MIRFRFFLLVFLIFQMAFSQQGGDQLLLDKDPVQKQTISEAELEPYLNDRDFNYETLESEENAFDRFLQWLKNALQSFFESIFGVEGAAGILLFIFRILPYILLGVLVFLLLRFFLRVNSNKLIGKIPPKGEVLISEEEQIIKNEDIPELIKAALANRDYRLAIRYYYLLALKHLSKEERILWEPQKTNEDYIRELQDSNLKSDFEKITRIYDYIWYGEFGVDASGFDSIKNDFDSLNSKLKLS